MTITYQDLVNYADEALPMRPDEWGTERQIDAENEFFRLARKFGVKTDAKHKEWELKSTTEERIQATMKIAQDIERVRMIDEFNKWGVAHKITHMHSADEMAMREDLTEEQVQYCADFSVRWNNMEDRTWSPAIHQWQVRMTLGYYSRVVTVCGENAQQAIDKAVRAIEAQARN